MANWHTDDEYLSGPAAMSLPPPHDTPYRTPSQASKMSRRSLTPPGRGPSPPMLQADRKERNSKRSSKDTSMDETISILDPRRFTPTLHANLVSEILALRRDQEEKTSIIETLEHNLDSSREEQRHAEEKFTSTAKENRSLKRQLALLEGGTSTALSELARERDEAVESIGDTKKRLEAAQKKIRSQEEDSERVHDLWSREKEEWEEERRKYERKVHVVESRLKMVLDEVAAAEAAQANGAHGAMNGNESDAESGTGAHNDGGSVRSMSMTNSIRFSFVPGAGKLNGQSLADELHSEPDDDDQTDIDGRESAMSHRTNYRHNRNLSRDSLLGRMHRRNQSLESLRRPGSVVRGRLMKNQAVLEALEGEDEPTEPKVEYVETGVQYSPPPSPILELARPVTPVTTQYDDKSSSPIVGQPPYSPQNQKEKESEMVSTASQTVGVPLSPPGTPQSRSETPPVEVPPLILVSAGTQTEEETLASPPQAVPPPPLTPPPPIPSISIMPPTSRPTTPREPRLPPLVKNFGCQVNISLSNVPTVEAGVQTEGIKVDQRIALLPPHLQPSSISSRPTSPNPTSPPVLELDTGFTPVPPRNPRRLADKPATHTAGRVGASPPSPAPSTVEPELNDIYPGHNDDGPLSHDASAPIKRPHRFSSLFAGFDTASSDEGEFGEDDLSDSEYRTALSAPRPPSVASRPVSLSPVITAPASPETPKITNARSMMRPISTEVYNSFSLADRDSKGGKSSAAPARSHERGGGSGLPGPGNRSSVMRKAAMIQSGIASHNGRPRSPSLTETRNPPFPIPKRESSRNPHMSASAPTSDGQRSPTRFDPWQRRGGGRSAYRSNSIRKVRSAAALPGNRRYRRQGSRSPPPLSPSTEAPESPGLPPLPRNDITTPRNRGRGHSHYRKHRNQPSTNTEITNNTVNTANTTNTDPASQASGNQTTGVVDAIAQTMVGEWMFKYVRRRKSFNVPDTTGKDDSGNDRHKRWVWLAPYERAILWSSKQPSSGSALMGKTGRKLTIQSVLDVKDDNPVPKGETSIFNRSILILTPQRALKFTAMTAERHYIWLTALSFLAHSSQALPDIVAPPPPQPKAQPLPEFEPPRPKGRRPGIRDSIRIAKGRNGGAVVGATGIPSIPSAPSSQTGDGASFRIPETIGTISSSHNRENSQDAAEPPFIPRFNDRSDRAAAVGVHGRKRSNTGGHVPPPLSFRGFSGPVSSVSSHNPTNSTAGASINTAGSSEYYQSQGSGNTGWGMSQTASQRTSEASSQRANFFDAIGTVRMEAFISPLQLSQFNEYPDEHDEIRQLARRRSKEWRRRRSRSRQRDSSSYASRGRRGSDDRYGSSRAVGEDDYFRDDPFRGF